MRLHWNMTCSNGKFTIDWNSLIRWAGIRNFSSWKAGAVFLHRHFTIRGADDTDFAGGIYHGRLILPPEYPFKPPHIIFLTKSGRFETNTKVCLSFSAFHPELWQPVRIPVRAE